MGTKYDGTSTSPTHNEIMAGDGRKSLWSQADIKRLAELVAQYGKRWGLIAQKLGRSRESCRMMWRRLRPSENSMVIDIPSTPAEEQVSYLRARVFQLEQQLRAMGQRLGKQLEIAEAIRTSIAAMPPYSANYKFSPSKPAKERARVKAVMLWSDWHIGEVISDDETEGLGAYNYATALKRFDSMLDGFFRWVALQREAYVIDELILVGLGDYISGIIHDELTSTNEFPAPEQAVKAGYLIAEGLRKAATHSEMIRFVGVGADNHSRLNRKPVAKRKYASSLSYVAHAVAREATRNLPGLKFVEANSVSHVEEIAGYRFLCTHGDTIRSWVGIPYYGIERRRHLEASARMGTDLAFSYMLLGHFHVPALIGGNTIINGSLSGTSEFDHSVGRRSEPAQVAFLVHPEHGVFNLLALRDATRVRL